MNLGSVQFKLLLWFSLLPSMRCFSAQKFLSQRKTNFAELQELLAHKGGSEMTGISFCKYVWYLDESHSILDSMFCRPDSQSYNILCGQTAAAMHHSPILPLSPLPTCFPFPHHVTTRALALTPPLPVRKVLQFCAW